MTSIQVFVLAFIVLTIQTIALIVFGFMFGAQGAVATGILFLSVDLILCACAIELKIIKEK